MQTFDSRKDLLELRKQLKSFASVYLDLPKKANADLRQEGGLSCLSVFLQLLFLRNLLDCDCLKNFCGNRVEGAKNLSSFSMSDLKFMSGELSEQIAFSVKNTVFSLPDFDLPSKNASKLLAMVDTMGSTVSRFDERFPGYIYQMYSEDRRTDALQQIQSASKYTTQQELIAFTQLYTPAWAADYLVRNSLESHSLASEDDLPKLSLLDPACGAGHILVRAFDFFFERYKNFRVDTKESVKHILGQNLVGTDIDPLALWVSALCLRLKTLKLTAGDPLSLALYDVSKSETPELGSLEDRWPQNHPLRKTYDAVVTNPPYLGRKLLPRSLKEILRIRYPLSCHDLSAAFLERGLSLLNRGGRLGFITQSSLLYLPSYGDLRAKIIKEYRLLSVVELASHAFPLLSGEKVSSMLFVAENLAPSGRKESKFVDLRNEKNKALALSMGTSATYLCRQEDFLLRRKQAFNYRLPDFLCRIFETSPSLGGVADIKQGLATTDNARFVRYFWEIPAHELGKKWFPYMKGAGSARWWSPVQNVVNWENDGKEIKEAVAASYPYLNGRIAWVVKNEQYYFRPGLTFSLVNSRQLSVRELPAGCIFDVAGSALFVPEEWRFFLLAYLNSSFISVCASMLNPTLNFQVGDLKLLPVVSFSVEQKQQLSELATRASAITRDLCQLPSLEQQATTFGAKREIAKSWAEFSTQSVQSVSALVAIEEEIDSLVISRVIEQYSLSAEDAKLLLELCREQAACRPSARVVPNSEQEYEQLIRERSLLPLQ